MANNEPLCSSPAGSEIPDKLYFRIGDVARLCEVPAYVLRFWESEFPQLKPNKGGTGQRLYRRKDVEMALRIKHLLYDEGYTISGARQIFKQEQRTTSAPQLALAIIPSSSPAKDIRLLRALRRELEALQELLARPVTPDGVLSLTRVRAVRSVRPSHGLSLTARNDQSIEQDLFGSQSNLPGEPD